MAGGEKPGMWEINKAQEEAAAKAKADAAAAAAKAATPVTTSNATGATTTTTPVATPIPGAATVGAINTTNLVDKSSSLISNPTGLLTGDNPNTAANESMSASQRESTTKIDPDTGTITDAQKEALKLSGTPNVSATSVGNQTASDIAKPETKTTQEDVAANQMTGANGTVSDQSKVTAEQADMKGLATGVNADGSINYTGEALAKSAQQKLSTIIDTSTVAGKQLAEAMGEGNYVDSKATLKGQLDILQNEFIDQATGEPKIPSWAAGTARNVAKIAAFGGVTGTAAVAAMSQALMEASLPIAQQDSAFFQTLTVTNLNNKQQSILNTAQTLAKFDAQNLDNRMTAAVENSKAFLQMDMKNLDNDQQAKVINNQARIQSILEDAKTENTNRLFVAQTTNDTNKFYDQLNSQIEQFNSAQTLDAGKFNSTMADSREKFEKEMSYNIDIANAKWRQTVQLQDDQQMHEANTQDVKNLVDISTSQLNKLWDRVDAQLDYAFKASESEKQRQAAVALAQMEINAKSSDSNSTAIGSLVGTFIGSDTGTAVLSKLFGL